MSSSHTPTTRIGFHWHLITQSHLVNELLISSTTDQVCDPQLLNQSKSHPYEPTGTSPYQPEDSPRAPLEVEPMTPPSTDEPPSPAASSSSSEQSDIVPPHPCTRKRGVPCRPNSRRRRRQSNNNSRNPSSSANRRAKVFICSFKRYGCDSTFGSKNEWKRHINSQHIKKSFWRCDLGNCNVSQQQRHPRVPNDFNRKDLFMQHVRRMHAPWGRAAAPSSRKKDQFEKQIILVTNRCHVRLRNPPPKSRCGFCSSTFTNWEMRLEHVGRHYEQGAPGEEAEDPDLRDWALNEGVIRMDHTTGKLTLT